MSTPFAMRVSVPVTAALTVLAVALAVFVGGAQASRHADGDPGSAQTSSTDSSTPLGGHGWID
jgi:hypothetical protein